MTTSPPPTLEAPHTRESQTPVAAGPGNRRRWIGLTLGPIVFVLMLLLPPPAGMELPAWRAAATGILMAIWWVTEAIPIPATALVPLALFPVLGVMDIDASAAPYANSVIFLFLGGFMIAQAMQRWDLHRRIALMVILAVGTQPVRLVGGFMLASAFISMWVSNTATAVMMLPIGLSVIHLTQARGESEGEPADPHFATALTLGIAYACSIGGLGTLIGTPPNALLAGYMLETTGEQIGFAEWMVLGVPLVVVGIPLTWLLLTRVVFPIRMGPIPGGAAMIRHELNRLGGWSAGERRVGLIFFLAAVAWMVRPILDDWIPGISDAGIAITAAVVLFLLPVDVAGGVFVIEWEDVKGLPWDVLVLFGGGLALASAISETGLASWIGTSMVGLRALPAIALVLAVTLVVIFLTELTSNTATAAAFIPIVGSLAIGLGENPLLLAVPAALAASCAFMLPVATPPNAIVYGGGYITLPQMARAGLYLNFLFTALIVTLGYGLMMLAFGV